MGIAVSTTGYEKPEDMLRDADAAMYRAKASGSGNYELFDAKMHQQAVNILNLETHLRQALEQNQFRVHYQPIIELDTDRVSGFEALIRWQHPERGLMLPGEFLAVAEDARLIVPMGRWILRQACTQLRQWQTSWPEALQWYMSVNVSSAELAFPGLVDYVAKTLQETRIPARCLKLEITESSLITNGQRAHQIMQSLKSFGVQLSIDDFGTGYSSFNYLHRFPFDVLKIDASFVSNFDQDSERQEIVRTIISLAHNLGLSVVAEGSETSSDLASLRKLPCQYAQGYSISKPVDGDNMTRFLSDRLKVD
jgi:EAL domain-containing protein (putative c-di-GMP-specific phosphodiesterase class I)